MRPAIVTTVLTLVLLATGRAAPAQAVAPPPPAPAPAPAPPPAAPGPGASAARLAGAQAVRERLGLVPEYEHVPAVESVRVAILDYGFDGLGNGRPYLPAGAVVVEHYDPEFIRRNDLGDPDYRKSFEPLNRHGRLMAQIVWAVTGSRPGGPRFYLLNANGPTMLRRAVRYAIQQRVHVILFSGAFEGGGNGDGRGPINRVVDEALDAGIIWINSAGNYGHRVYNGPARVLSDGYLRLRDGVDVASLRFRNRLDENAVTVTLTWNDYRDTEDAGTDKDLDLYVENWSGRLVGASEKVQVDRDRVAGPDESRNPRERVVLTDLPANPVVPSDPDYCYRIRIRAKRGRFGASDKVRVLVTAARDAYVPPGADAPEPAVEFVDASGWGELYPPADHPRVLTVGDASPASSAGPTTDRRVKPDVVLADSRAYFTDGDISAGSSNSAAYVAGVVAVLKAVEPGLQPRLMLRLMHQGNATRRVAATPFDQASTARRVTPEASLLSPPPPPVPATSPGPLPWQTPSRARLAEVVRGGG
jgi:hypothetical protein